MASPVILTSTGRPRVGRPSPAERRAQCGHSAAARQPQTEVPAASPEEVSSVPCGALWCVASAKPWRRSSGIQRNSRPHPQRKGLHSPWGFSLPASSLGFPPQASDAVRCGGGPSPASTAPATVLLVKCSEPAILAPIGCANAVKSAHDVSRCGNRQEPHWKHGFKSVALTVVVRTYDLTHVLVQIRQWEHPIMGAMSLWT